MRGVERGGHGILAGHKAVAAACVRRIAAETSTVQVVENPMDVGFHGAV